MYRPGSRDCKHVQRRLIGSTPPRTAIQKQRTNPKEEHPQREQVPNRGVLIRGASKREEPVRTNTSAVTVQEMYKKYLIKK